MATTSNRGNNRTEESIKNSDFIPPEHSYVQHQPFNSAFFRDHVEEEYQIQRAFQPNNFTYLRNKIPNQLKYGAILEERVKKVQENVEEETANRNKTPVQRQEQRREKIARKKMQQVGQLGYFEVFPYQESLYGLQHQYEIREKEKGRRQQEKISELNFRPAGFDKKLKYENPFSYVDRRGQTQGFEKQKYIFPFHLPEDTYDRFHDSEIRSKIIQEAGKIAGDFIPSKNQKSLTKVNRSKAVQIIKEIQVYLKRYVPAIGFFIGINKKDHIDILFEQSFLEDTRLHLLMSRICESQELSKYLLRRNPTKWGKLGTSGYLQFTLLPPWVKDPEESLNRE